MNNQSTQRLWQERSLNFGSRIEGVLPKSWPRKLNKYLDEWMYQNIRQQISKKKLKVLDLGCGYGRLSKKVLTSYPDAATYGVDIAQGYVDIYNKDLSPRGKAVVGDIKKLPYKDGFFDVIFMVTTLMYLPKKSDQKKAMREIFRVLAKAGKFVIIERNPLGHNIINLFGLVPAIRGASKKEIGSVSFTKSELMQLIKMSGGQVERVIGLPIFTLLFYPLFFLTKLNISDQLLKFTKRVDLRVNQLLLTLSLYLSYSGTKL